MRGDAQEVNMGRFVSRFVNKLSKIKVQVLLLNQQRQMESSANSFSVS